MRFLWAIGFCCIFLAGCCKEQEVPAQLRNLHSSDAGTRNEAALALARCGSLAERAVPRLIQMLYDDNVGVQSSAAYALRQIDTPAAREALEWATAKKKAR